jgi:GT2 family glycosyltransferase
MTVYNEHPRVTAGVLSFNRKDDLRVTLERLLEDEYPNLEILLLDNASTDGTREMLEKDFAPRHDFRLRILYAETNTGVGARNVIFREALGAYLFSLDDDSYPSTPQLLTETVRMMEEDESIAALCCACVHPVTGYNETIGIERFASGGDSRRGYDIVNVAPGGTIFRMSDVLKTHLFDEEFFYAREELDFGFQLVQLGRRIVFRPDCVVYHVMSPANRFAYTRLMQFTRNTVWTIWKFFPLGVAIPLNLLFFLRRLAALLKDPRRFAPVCSGFFKGMRGYRRMRRKEQKFTFSQTLRLWRSLYKILYE